MLKQLIFHGGRGDFSGPNVREKGVFSKLEKAATSPCIVLSEGAGLRPGEGVETPSARRRAPGRHGDQRADLSTRTELLVVTATASKVNPPGARTFLDLP